MSHQDKQAAYQCDITYGTNNEFGFDYLRDNMVHDIAQRVQRPLHFSIIDEADTILIDEARTPLIISGQVQKVKKQLENQTLASMSLQNYFRLYSKLSGMTGTASADVLELEKIYNLQVVIVPTHKPIIRDDLDDLVFMDQQSKFEAILKEIKTCNKKQQPVLVGTASIEASELLSDFLNKAKIKHAVLNAKDHKREAGVMSQAGLPGAVTIVTNMAGRGADIMLGGNLDAELARIDEGNNAKKIACRIAWKRRYNDVMASGGLHVIGTERHESRRIDNQLRAFSGVRGEPGSSRFYLSLEDQLMQIFGSDRIKSLLTKMKIKPGESIQSSLVHKAIEKAQRKVESHNFDIRQQLLDYDDVANDQRKVIYERRNQFLTADSNELVTLIKPIVEKEVSSCLEECIAKYPKDVLKALVALEAKLKEKFALSVPIDEWLKGVDKGSREADLDYCIKKTTSLFFDSLKIKFSDQKALDHFYRSVGLNAIDHHWFKLLNELDQLRSSIGLRGYQQKDPLQEYKREAFEMFDAGIDAIEQDILSALIKANR
jgi:preprotein translocase subunit SecA